MTRLLVTLCALAALSGCTVPVVGSAGIGSSTGSVTFTGDRLGEMTPGQVLYQSGYDEKAEQDVYTTGSVRRFQAFACR